MGNIVNQYIAANEPKIKSLQDSVNSLQSTVSNLELQYGTLSASRDSYIQQLDLIKAKLRTSGLPPTVIVGMTTQASQLQSTINGITAQMDAVAKQLASAKAELTNAAKALETATADYAAGLIEAQRTEDVSAAQSSASQAAAAAATNPEIIATKVNADVAIKTAEIEAKAAEDRKTRNTNTIVIVVAIVVVIGILAWALTRGGK